MTAPPVSRVSHPILRLEVLDARGSRTAEQHVFCRLRRESVDVDFCRMCDRRDAIQTAPTPSVDCTFAPQPHDVIPDPHGDRTEVGVLLREGTIALACSASLLDALALLSASDFRTVAVVGGDHILVGLLHETVVAERCAKLADANVGVKAAMSSPLAVHEATPVRDALRFMAAAHLRQATVVTSAGVPLGVLRDVDALRWIAASEHRLSTPPRSPP